MFTRKSHFAIIRGSAGCAIRLSHRSDCQSDLLGYTLPMAKPSFLRQPLILASASPRRQQLLALLGLPFLVVAADIDERPRQGEDPAHLVVRLSLAKACAVARQEFGGLVIASDTVVVFEGQILGKPADEEEASAMLRRMRGRPHTVYSGLALVDTATGRDVTDLAETRVWMRDYADDEIARYVASGDPLDKAGAYAIQDGRFRPAARVEGCYTSVMGLPLCHLYHALALLGRMPPQTPVASCRDFTGHDCQVHARILAAARLSVDG